MHAVAPSSTPKRHAALLSSDFPLLIDEPLASDSFNAVTVPYPPVKPDLTVRSQNACQGLIRPTT